MSSLNIFCSKLLNYIFLTLCNACFSSRIVCCVLYCSFFNSFGFIFLQLWIILKIDSHLASDIIFGFLDGVSFRVYVALLASASNHQRFFQVSRPCKLLEFSLFLLCWTIYLYDIILKYYFKQSQVYYDCKYLSHIKFDQLV